ncbi:acyltransferase [Pseudoalteromonas carrageenovora]|nr:acyltransferase [Pseudoalteromonas carrageenovora]MDO6635782.1 acyltransferase [Pseudoalteromonas carrageenovora]MDO6647775.1 acyltransferase [Pseudoalteromonas carrageenovora]
MLKKLVNLIFHDKLFYILALIQRWSHFRIRKARGEIELNKIKNKGVNCTFQGELLVAYRDRLKIGDNVRVGYGGYLFCIGGLTIGDNTQISRNVLIYTGNHDINGTAIPFDDTYVLKPVNIGNSVWIGMNVTITPGVNIGDGAVIGMGTVVSKDVAPGAIVVGAQQRVVKYRDMDDFYNKLGAERLYGKIWPSE